MSDSNSYYDLEEQSSPRRQEEKESFYRGLTIGLITAALVAVLLTALNVRTILQARRIQEAYSQGPAHTVTEADVDSREDKLRLLEEYVDTYYYKSEEVSEEDRSNGIYKGLLQSLGDPYSVYYSADAYKALNEQLAGSFSGIGAYIGLDPDSGAPMIMGVFDDCPAKKAGLDNGDCFYEVDGTNVTSMSTEEVVALVRGEAGTSVHLKMVRDGEYLEVDVTRELLDVPTVAWLMLEDEKTGYIQITQFSNTTSRQFAKGLEELKSSGMERMILDLRDNPGGTVSSVLGVAEQILPKGLVFYMESKTDGRLEYDCKGAGFDCPLVVLVNSYTASASEILSGAVQDAGIGTVMGTRTFGKGVVQTVFDLPDASGLKLTVGKYFTRGGQDINEKGITPDIECGLDMDLLEKEGTDSQLRDALDYLNGSYEAPEDRQDAALAD